MANLIACEVANDVGGGVFDLHGVASIQNPDFAVHFLLEHDELSQARRSGRSLLAEGERTIGDRVVETRMLFYDWMPGSGALEEHQTVPLSDVPPGRYELQLAAGDAILARLTVRIRESQ